MLSFCDRHRISIFHVDLFICIYHILSITVKHQIPRIKTPDQNYELQNFKNLGKSVGT